MLTSQAIAALLRRGYAALEAGRTAEAAGCARDALNADRHLAPAHFLVGLAALQANERQVAFEAFASTTQIEPRHAAAWAQLARLFLGEGQVNRADYAIRLAVEHDNADPLVHDLIGTVMSMLGEYGDAAQWYRRAAKARPDHPPFLQNLANNQVYLGNTAAAVDLYQRILDIDPGHAQAHWGLAGARRADDRAHIDTMRRILATPGLHPRTRAFLNYAIGKECEDIAAWDEAFDAFASGAAARRQTVEYDEANEIATFAALSELFSADWLDGRQDGTATGPAPIFIVGQPRTGTTLIERILAAHSQVHAAGELQHFTLGIRRLSDYRDPRRFTPELYARARNLDPADLGRTYLETTRRLQGNRPRFIDKLPQNYLNVPLILAALPHARILHLTRDPMDACFASFKQLFADAYLHSYRQDEMARHHVRYHQLMSIWRQRFPGRFLDVSYEATVQDVEGVTRALLDWLQLPFEDACLNFHAQSGAVATASAAQVREPAHTRSVGRWRRYAAGLEPMRRILATARLA